MNAAIQFLMLSCKKATALSDQKLEAELSWVDNVRLKLHTSICDGCKLYMNQSAFLDKALHVHFENLRTETFTVIENNPLKEKLNSKF